MANEKHRRAFISYSRVNKEFASKLTKGLRTAGYPVWFDLFDIPTGARWDDEVEKALRECSIFMVILTPASIASENVKDEIGYAIDHGKRILPVLLEECDVPLRLRRFQYVDFTTKSFEEGFASAKGLLGDLIDEASVPVPATAPVSETKIDKKAEEEQTAKAKAETERKAKEESDRLAAQKTEAARVAKQKADAELAAKARAETERKAKEESDRLAAQKAEATPVPAMPAEMKAETASVPVTQKKPISKGLVIGIVAVAVLCIAGAGIGYGIINSGTPATATEAPDVGNPATEAPVVDSANPSSNSPACPWDNSQPIQVTFENQSGLSLDYYWINFNCELEYYGSLGSGEAITLDTYVSYVWQFYNPTDGSFYTEYTTDTNGYFAVPDNAPAATEAPAGDNKLIYYDDFLDPNSGWTLDDNQSIGDDGYYYVTAASNSFTESTNTNVNFADYGPDVVITLFAYIGDGVAGTYCRQQADGREYVFLILNDGTYNILYYDGNWESLSSGSFTVSEPYSMVATCIGDNLSLYVNGEQMASVTDTRIVDGGGIGLHTESLQPSGSTVAYGEFTANLP